MSCTILVDYYTYDEHKIEYKNYFTNKMAHVAQVTIPYNLFIILKIVVINIITRVKKKEDMNIK